MSLPLVVRGVALPSLLYGTAWKEDRTSELTALALASGFRGIDTANQRKHYHEAAVGAAVRAALASGSTGSPGSIPRGELFLQTKFTYARGQDQRLPYDPKASLTAQVRQSMASSLEHLGVTEVDSLLLHGPSSDRGWSAADREVWRTMEALQGEGKVRLLGVSNVAVGQLEALCQEATVRPTFVQNRCYARTGWDRELREKCAELDVVYQGFSLLTANRNELAQPVVRAMAQRYRLTTEQLVFAFAGAVGMLPLTGTSSKAHMKEDLRGRGVELQGEDVEVLEGLAEER